MAYYRKYRPQTIDELDNALLREKLYAILCKKDIPHAFLFTGPKGLGKTSTARIIAKAINCLHESKTKNPTEPDNTCDMCTSITNGTNIDVLEIDGASNRGIDEVRDLREKVKLAPARAKKKVYIIDEVHMLTTEAFNALLKTIEEPPAHVIFIFCTTEPHKVPSTIISRCMHISLTRATEDELVRSLKRIVAGEKLSIDEDALKEIARMGDGGFRDATKILEEIVSLTDSKKITKELVEEKLNVSSISYFVSSILTSLSDKNTKQALAFIGEAVEKGVEIKFLIAQLIEALHELLLVNIGLHQETKYQILNTKYSIENIQALVAMLDEAYKQTKFASIPQLPLEMLVISWCSNEGSNETKESEDSKESPSSKPTIKDFYKKEQTLKVQQILKPTEIKKVVKEVKDDDKQEKIVNKDELERLMENIIYKIKPFNHSVAGVLRGCSIKSYKDGVVTFVTAYKFHKEKLEEAKIREILEKVLQEVTGKSTKIVIELKG